MNDWNWVSVIVVLGVFLLWKIELAATLLNIRAFPSRVPAPLAGLMSEEKLAQAKQYLQDNSKFHIVQDAFGIAVLLSFWAMDGFDMLDQYLRSFELPAIATGILFLATLGLAQAVLGWGFSYFATFVIEEKYGFNRSTKKTFVIDQCKGLVLSALIGLPLAAAVLWIFQNVPNAWLWAWIVVTLFQLLLTYLAPTWIMPLFNRFSPMPDGELKKAINQLGEQCGFPLENVLVMDGSKRSTKANAFFTGFGKHKKIALYDTLMEKSSQAELLAILAHEIGHFRCGHIRQRLCVGIAQTAVLFFLIGMIVNPQGAIARAVFDAFGVSQISAHVGLVLFMVLFEPIGKLLGIASHAWSRKHEYEADAYAAKVTGNASALVEALKKLSSDTLSHPSPASLRVWLDYSHPPLLYRLNSLEKAD